MIDGSFWFAQRFAVYPWWFNAILWGVLAIIGWRLLVWNLRNEINRRGRP